MKEGLKATKHTRIPPIGEKGYPIPSVSSMFGWLDWAFVLPMVHKCQILYLCVLIFSDKAPLRKPMSYERKLMPDKTRLQISVERFNTHFSMSLGIWLSMSSRNNHFFSIFINDHFHLKFSINICSSFYKSMTLLMGIWMSNDWQLQNICCNLHYFHLWTNNNDQLTKVCTVPHKQTVHVLRYFKSTRSTEEFHGHTT